MIYHIHVGHIPTTPCSFFIANKTNSAMPILYLNMIKCKIEKKQTNKQTNKEKKEQNGRIKNIVSVFDGIQCSLNNFELSATIMTNSSPDHNTSVSKTVGTHTGS